MSYATLRSLVLIRCPFVCSLPRGHFKAALPMNHIFNLAHARSISIKLPLHLRSVSSDIIPLPHFSLSYGPWIS
ncbi:hypothetical protein BC827DRAFT_799960 [Russula dissimulans]|nr:hypothetical protein BC827DRAFT_799960 [Russula dissimulans]